MNGKSLSLFIDDLYHNPEMEIEHNNIRYMITGYIDNSDYVLKMDTIEEKSKNIFSFSNTNREICVNKFESAKIFSGKTIYEAESEITVLYG